MKARWSGHQADPYAAIASLEAMNPLVCRPSEAVFRVASRLAGVDPSWIRRAVVVQPPASVCPFSRGTVFMSSFADLNLSPPVLRGLAAQGYSTPTPIQSKAIPHVLAGRDLFGCAQTGTGKTAAFALPLIERMLASPRPRTPGCCRTLVLAPTRELAGQIHESFQAYGRHAGLASVVVYGGVGQRPQADALRRGSDVLVATPGRLLDLIGQRLADVRRVEFLVLDEADRMLDMGFIHDVRRIVSLLPVERQTLFFSATLPDEVRRLADSMLRDPLEVRTAPQATPAETVEQSVFHVSKGEKRMALVSLLRSEPMDRVIVFTRTKHGADKLQRDLARAGIDAAAIHGNKSQNQRERALAAFKAPRPPVLIATDIAARGIDVDGVSHVVNFELPHEPETYVHRIGRTGRAGRQGEAVSFCDPEERLRLRAIERLLRQAIRPRNAAPPLVESEVSSMSAGRSTGERRSRDPRGSGRDGSGRRTRSSGPSGGKRRGQRSDSPRVEPAAQAAPVQPAAAGPATAGSLRRPRNRHRRAL
jgi:ATP-dependent RNA helicase RhlE